MAAPLTSLRKASQYVHTIHPKYFRHSIDTAAIAAVGYVTPPSTFPAGTRTVLFDLHETLAHVEPINYDGSARGAPEGCKEDGWAVSTTNEHHDNPLAPTVIKGPAGRGDFQLTLRNGAPQIMQILKADNNIEGMLWTVGGLLYVTTVIQTLEGSAAGGKGFQHLIRSDSSRFGENGDDLGASDWPFLPDLKPLDLVPRNPKNCLQIDDRGEYLRCNPDNALLIAPFFGAVQDRQLVQVAEILERLDKEDRSMAIPEFLSSLPPHLCKKVEVANGVTMSTVV